MPEQSTNDVLPDDVIHGSDDDVWKENESAKPEKRRPWLGLIALSFTLIALAGFTAGPRVISALENHSSRTDPSPAPEILPTPPPAAVEKQDASEEAAQEGVDWRSIGAGLLRAGAERLADEGTADEDGPSTDAASAPLEEGAGFSFESDGISFHLTFGNTSTAVGLPFATRPAWIGKVEAGLLIGSLIAAGLSVVLGITSTLSKDPWWLGVVAATGGSIVFIAYVVAIIATILFGLLMIIIIGAILSGIAAGGVSL